MLSFFNRYATPFTAGLFLVSLISGVALYFGVAQGYFHQMHEVLSMVLIVPFVLHIWKNWRPLQNYLKRAPMYVAAALSLVAALYYVVPQIGAARTGGRPMPAQFTLGQRVLTSSVSSVAPMLGLTADELAAKLTDAGLSVASNDSSLDSIAQASGIDSQTMAKDLLTLAQ